MPVFHSRIAQGLARTRELLLTDLSEIFKAGGRFDDELFDELEDRLLEADLGTTAVEEIRERLGGEYHKRNIKGPEEVIAIISGVVEEMLTTATRPRCFGDAFEEKPHVILFVGVNGSGKTTTIGKLAHCYKEVDKRVVIAAADTYRAAAVEQLAIWAERAGADCVRSHEGADPAAVAYDALEATLARKADVLLVDTAGRLHTRKGLMDELAKIRRVLAGRMNGAPHETLLVLDATTGQNALVQGEEFRKAVDVTGLILTKLDGTARGGVVVAIAQQLGIPVEMVGVGEELDALHPFDAREFAQALLTAESS